MAAKPKTQLGVIACRCCQRDIPVRAAENGTLNVSCGWCDFSAYAKAGTEANRLIRGQMAPAADPLPLVLREPEPKAAAPAPAAPPATPKPAAPAPTPKPAPAPVKRTIFG